MDINIYENAKKKKKEKQVISETICTWRTSLQIFNLAHAKTIKTMLNKSCSTITDHLIKITSLN